MPTQPLYPSKNWSKGAKVQVSREHLVIFITIFLFPLCTFEVLIPFFADFSICDVNEVGLCSPSSSWTESALSPGISEPSKETEIITDSCNISKTSQQHSLPAGNLDAVHDFHSFPAFTSNTVKARLAKKLVTKLLSAKSRFSAISSGLMY